VGFAVENRNILSVGLTYLAVAGAFSSLCLDSPKRVGRRFPDAATVRPIQQPVQVNPFLLFIL